MSIVFTRLSTWLMHKYVQYEYARPFGATATVSRYLAIVVFMLPVHIYLAYWFMQKTAEPAIRDLMHALSMAHSTMILPSCLFIGLCLTSLYKRRYEQLVHALISVSYLSLCTYMTYLDARIGGSTGQGYLVFVMVVLGLSVVTVAPPYVTAPFFIFTVLGSSIGLYQLSNEVYSNNPGLLVNILLTIPITILVSTLVWSQFSANLNLTKDLNSLRKQLARALLDLDSVVGTDQVTGLYNPKKFCEVASRDFCIVARQCDPGEESGYLLIDVNSLAKINLDYGFYSGDNVLKQLGKLLVRETRSTDVTGRAYAGVFSVFLPATNLARATLVAEKLRVAVEDYTVVSLGSRDTTSIAVNLTVNIGVTSGIEPPWSTDDGVPSALFIRSKQALADSKKIGRNLVVSLPGPKNLTAYKRYSSTT